MLKVKTFGDRQDVKAFYRPDTTDEKVLKEVIEARAYRRKSAGFDVEEGERWLDLGANIGAFAIYCRLKGATAVCYEPEPVCFDILKRNAPKFECHRAAVSAFKEDSVDLWSSSIKGNHYRGTLVGGKGMMKKESTSVPNVYAGDIEGDFDGVKMDIEGSEFGIIDNGLIPPCNKLCFEYHTSRDKSMKNLSRRIATLKKLFKTVAYVPELDRIMAMGGQQKSFHDRVIYCIGRR